MNRSLLLILLALAPPASASDFGDLEIEDKVEAGIHTKTALGPRAVYYRPLDTDGGTWSPGIQLKLPMSNIHAMQLSVDYSEHTWNGDRFRVIPVQFSFIGYFIPDSPAAPFLLLGGGWYIQSVSGTAAHTESTFYPHVGGGLELEVGDHLTIDASYRYMWNFVYRPSDFKKVAGAGYRDKGSMVTTALNWRF